MFEKIPPREENIPQEVVDEYTQLTGKTTEEYLESKRKVDQFMRETLLETLCKMPMWTRFTFVYRTIRVVKASNPQFTDADIDWDTINELLRKNVGKYDFNDFGRIESEDQLLWITAEVMSSPMDDGPWYKDTCKCCGKKFFMFYKEVQYFENRGLELPKRCKDCRTARKNGTPIKVAPEPVKVPDKPKAKPQEVAETSGTMAEALKKAGLLG